MKRIIALFAAALFTLSLTGFAVAEEPKKDDAAAKEVKAEKKEVKAEKKDAKKGKKVEKKEEAKPAKKKKEAAGC